MKSSFLSIDRPSLSFHTLWQEPINIVPSASGRGLYPPREITINLGGISAPNNVLKTWHVRESAFAHHEDFHADLPTLKFALHSLTNADFAASTITSQSSSKPLESKIEIQYNAIWRFLHLRGYINDDHTVSPWGKVLDAIQSKLNPLLVSEDAPLLAVELLRMDLLTTGAMMELYAPLSNRGSGALSDTMTQNPANTHRIRPA